MKQEIHIITNKGCDQHPKDSLHAVKIDDKGIRWTVLGINSIHPSVTSKKTQSEIIHGRICNNCANTFNWNGAKTFRDGICGRCHEKQTKVDR